QSDGIHYYAFLRSALFDRDLDFANDYPLLGSDYKSPNVLPVGAPLLWAPLVSAVHLGREAAQEFGVSAPLGTEPTYAAAVCLASFAYGAAGLVLLLRILRRFAVPRVAFWVTVIVWVGSPLRFYMSVLPSMAHACEFFAAVLVLWACLDLRTSPEVGPAWRVGLACGLLFLVRSQDGLVLVLPGLLLLAGLLRRGLGTVRSTLLPLLALVGGFALAALPQVLVWQAQFGVPLLVPHKKIHGAGFFHAADPELWGALLSPRGGLFVTYPAVLLAVVGLGALAVGLRPATEPTDDPESPAPNPGFDTVYVMCLLPVLLATWWLNASVFDWYQVRRYTGLVPFLAPGLAVVLSPLSRAGSLVMALAAFLSWRYDDAVDARRNNPGDPVPVRSAVLTLADRLVAEGYAMGEPWAPRASARLLGAYTGEPVLEDQVTYVDLSGNASVLTLPRPARFLSSPEVEDGRSARWVSERYARIFVPLAWRGPLFVRLEARALETREPQELALEWNGVACGALAMEPVWREYAFAVPADAVRLGTNEVVLRFARAPLYFRVRGEGPHEVRPAAVRWLTLNRAGPRIP
ncbi:MAG TPA: hypothetical protein VMV21_18775, partial [Vicinamibacteria bacterium]|nr:hypothetical protein [Vicinamibacteria bacterium]